jgi:uncharacterized delta-60 repeat protein
MREKFLLILIAIVIQVSFLTLSSGAAVTPLDGFDPDADDVVIDLVVQPDGNVLVGGYFTTIAGTAQNYLARLNTDGSLDIDFSPDIGWLPNGHVKDIALQPDGKIVIAGVFASVDGHVRGGIARLNADGSLDTSFSISLVGGVAHALAIQPDNKILVGGAFDTINGITRNKIARFHPDGSLETGFNPVVEGETGTVSVLSLTIQSDNKILVGGRFDSINGVPRNNIARLKPDGRLDTKFNPDANNIVWAIVIQPDGKILIGGGFLSVGGQYRTLVARLERDGSLDQDFAPFVVGEAITNITLQKDGKILIAGGFAIVAGEARLSIARLYSDGTIDMEFNPVLDKAAFTLAVQADGRVLLGGTFTDVDGTTRNHIARLNIDDTLDVDFIAHANQRVITLALQPDGKILVGGEMTILKSIPGSYLYRLNGDGTVDTAFNDLPVDGPQANGHVYSLAVQSDGKVLMGGAFTHVRSESRENLARLNTDGSLDMDFNPGASGPVRAFVIQPDGKIIIGGSFNSIHATSRKRIARLNKDGSLDASFNPDVNNNVLSLALQSDGKILLGGLFTSIESEERNYIARLNADGTLDAGFNPDADNMVAALAIQIDGKILMGGAFAHIGSDEQVRIARLNTNGSLDTDFSPEADNAVASMALQSDGKIVLGGAFTQIKSGGLFIPRHYIARLNSNGTLDMQFNPDANNLVHCLAIQTDGKIILGGDFTFIDVVKPRSYLARLSASGAALQSLSVGNDGHSFTWMRSGTGPELERVTFELSSDFTTWSSIGSGSRLAGGWQLMNGIMLPLEEIRYIRTRGYYSSGTFNGSGSVIESVWQVYRARASTFSWPMFVPAITGAGIR